MKNKLLHSTIALSVLLASGAVNAQASSTPNVDPILNVKFEDNANPKANQYLEKMFTAFVAKDKTDLKSILSDNFVQKLGIKENKYDDFVQHSSYISNNIRQINFTFKDVNVDADGTVSEIHVVEATKLDGSITKAKLYVFHYFDKNGKLMKIDELSTMIEGSEADKDLGFRTK
ncbi:hypothetical protein [Vibrio sagamiensis]|uniref:hypothetical protein n=1 Tax=Vibrio sagamiensis TaxID=512650 RepID=UPI00039AA65E|nr:hypothetical protein [Vibrio sagamiensis]